MLPLFFSIFPPPPRSTLFPYTTLFRSHRVRHRAHHHRAQGVLPAEFLAQHPGHPRSAASGRRRPPSVHRPPDPGGLPEDRKSTRLNSSHANISYAVFCLKKKKQIRSTV